MVSMAVFLSGSIAHSSEAAWYNGKWAHEQPGTDLQPDSEVRFGRMPNGVRYAVLPNEHPKGRATLYLNVQTGSLMETQNELGFAHFVEHMAFNGSRNFPAGTLIPFFQKHGMDFGGDANAHTSRLETVYKINLANTKQDSLKMGLKVLRDFADGITFEPAEVEIEKGVILAEKYARESEVMLSRRKRTETLYQGTAFVNFPIGTEECIKSATSEKLRSFYRKWYHPERMIVLVVGDIAPEQIVPLVEQAFASVANPGPLQYPESWGNAELGGLAAMGEKRETSGEELAVILRFARGHVHDSRKKRLDMLIELVISQCMRQRLLSRDQQESLWNDARFMSRTTDGLQPTASFVVTTHLGGWEKALAAIAGEAGNAATKGFSGKEVAHALEVVEKNLRRAHGQKRGKNNSDKADELVATINKDIVHTSSGFDLELFGEQRKLVTAQAVSAAAVKLLGMKDVFLAVGGPNPPMQEDVLKVWRDGLAAATDGPARLSEKSFPYLPLPAQPEGPEPATDRRLVTVLNGKEITLYEANLNQSLRLHVLPLQFEPDKAWVQLLFGRGYAARENADVILARTASAVLAESGTGSLGRAGTQRLTDVLGGKGSEVHGPYHSSISITGDASSLEGMLQAVWTQFSDPHIDETSLKRALRVLGTAERAQRETVDTVTRVDGKAFFYGDAPRFHALTLSDAQTCTLDALQRYLKHSRTEGPLHLVIGGDVDLAQAVRLTQRYFSGFTAQAAGRAAPLSLQFPAGQEHNAEVPDPVDKVVVKRAWRI